MAKFSIDFEKRASLRGEVNGIPSDATTSEEPREPGQITQPLYRPAVVRVKATGDGKVP